MYGKALFGYEEEFMWTHFKTFPPHYNSWIPNQWRPAKTSRKVFHLYADFINREFKKLRRQLQRKRHNKIELCVKLSLLRLFHVDHIVQTEVGELHFRLLGTNGFHVKAKSERLTAASSRCRQNLKHENFTASFGRQRQTFVPKSVPHVQHDYFSPFNQSNHWFVTLSLTVPSSNLKLPNDLSLLRNISVELRPSSLTTWPVCLLLTWDIKQGTEICGTLP